MTHCSDPKAGFWFNPVEVLVSELLAGASIALPAQVKTILDLLRIGSRVMFAFFLTSTCLNFILLLISPVVMRSRWYSLAVTILGFISALLVTVAAIIATAISVAAKVALTAQDQLNISAEIGIRMFVFMWIAAVFTDIAFLLHAALGCCCKPQARTASGSPASRQSASMEEKSRKPGLPNFVRRRRAGYTS